MTRPFKIYRIICTLTDKALVYGSEWPNRPVPYDYYGQPRWYARGNWSASGGQFWKTENAVRKHLRRLCYDWITKSAPAKYPTYAGQRDHWHEPIPGAPDWSRLQHLRVEQIYVSNYQTTMLSASDFMGISAPADAPVEASPRQVEQPNRDDQ